MSKRHAGDFRYPESKPVFKHLEHAAYLHGDVSRIFGDWLHMVVCALSGGRMEPAYLETVGRYSKGEPGKRACDHLAHAFAALVEGMDANPADLLGDLFEGAVSFGEHGQFFTPECICDMMAQLQVHDIPDLPAPRVSDPCCGSGRLLLSVAKLLPKAILYGTDVDRRCAHMTAINLALRGWRGVVTCGNSLTLEMRESYVVGFDGVGVLRLAEPAGVVETRADLGIEPEPEPDAAEPVASAAIEPGPKPARKGKRAGKPTVVRQAALFPEDEDAA